MTSPYQKHSQNGNLGGNRGESVKRSNFGSHYGKALTNMRRAMYDLLTIFRKIDQHIFTNYPVKSAIASTLLMSQNGKMGLRNFKGQI